MTKEGFLEVTVRILEESSLIRVDKGTPVTLAKVCLVGILSILSCIYQLSTHTPDALSVFLSELRSNFSFCIGQLVVFIALDSSHQSIVGSLIHTVYVNLFILLHHLILCFGGTFLIEFIHSQINELVVSFCFLLVVGQLSKGALQQVISLLESLSLQN